MKTVPRSTLPVALLALLALGGSAKDKHKPNSAAPAATSVVVGVQVFTDPDRHAIRHYVAAPPPGGLPPGLAKRGGSLPPGLEKHLRKNGTLPPGLQKKVSPFPPELERRLTPLGPDLRRGFIEGRAVIYNRKTSIVLDVLIPL